jgi:hypothetical protein
MDNRAVRTPPVFRGSMIGSQLQVFRGLETAEFPFANLPEALRRAEGVAPGTLIFSTPSTPAQAPE